MADDRFGERIILLNKEKVRPLANAKLDEFLREVVALNVLLLWKCREAVLRTTGATSHGNCHFLVAKLPDVSLLIKHMAGDSIFEEKLGQCGAQNGNSNLSSAFVDPFTEGTARLSTGIPISRYVYKVRGNWDNYEMSSAPVAADNETDNNDAGNEDLGGLPDDDPNKLYRVYD